MRRMSFKGYRYDIDVQIAPPGRLMAFFRWALGFLLDGIFNADPY